MIDSHLKLNMKSSLKKNYGVYDVMATLSEFTVESVAISLDLLPKKVDNILVTGGGHKTFI